MRVTVDSRPATIRKVRSTGEPMQTVRVVGIRLVSGVVVVEMQSATTGGAA